MKNKLKWFVSLAILFTLALLAFTGCETETRRYNLEQVSIVTMSDAIEDVLSSTVVVEVIENDSTRYYSVGVAVTEKLIVVPKQTIPLTEVLDNVFPRVVFKGKSTSQTQRFDLKYESRYNNFSVDDCGFVVLSVVDSNIKLNPVKFASVNTESNDIIGFGELMFGVQILLPDSNCWGTSVTSTANTPASEYFSTIPVMVSSKQMMTGNFDPYTQLELSEKMVDSTFTTQGYFQKSDFDTYSNFLTIYKLHHGFKKVSDSKDFCLTNCMLFNKAGEFVGINYMRRSDNEGNNEHVVAGIGYACRSNSIKDLLKSKGIEVA